MSVAERATSPKTPARPPLGKRVRRALKYAAIVALLLSIRLLPLGAAKALGRALGGLAYHLFGRDRRLAHAHLQKALPSLSEAERTAIARRMFRGFGEGAAELALVHRLDATLDDYVRIEPEAQRVMDEALAGGKGVLAITGHIGNWELLFRRFRHGGLDAYAVGREAYDERVTRLVERLRGPGRTVWRGAPGAAKQLLRSLRNNAVLALLIDQDTKVQGVFVPFFGELAHTPRAPADLALRTGAAVVAVFIHRRPDGGHVVNARRVPVPDGGEPELAAVALTAAMTEAIEDEVRRVPHEWVWLHRRWKTRPSAPPAAREPT